MATGTFALPLSSGENEFGWTRPSDWLPMPAIGTQEFIGLLAITDDEMNHIALSFAGNYTVNWGDGVTENYNIGVVAQHSYTYASISNATLSTRGYKQVLVRVTPQSGQNLTTINLQQQNSLIAKVHAVSWLEMAINGASFTVLTLGGGSVRNGMCEQVTIGTTGVLTNLLNLFQFFTSLQSVPLFDTSSVTVFQGMFFVCTSLKRIPPINTGAGTTFQNTFSSCYSLSSIPPINTGAGVTFTSMFNDCPSLQSLPNLNTALGNSFGAMLTGCASLAKGAFQGTRYGITYNACLNRAEIVNVFNGLGTAVGAQTLSISGNPGWATVSAAEKLIATNKGFTLA